MPRLKAPELEAANIEEETLEPIPSHPTALAVPENKAAIGTEAIATCKAISSRASSS